MTSEKSYATEQRVNALVGGLSVTDSNGWTNVSRLNGWAAISGQAHPMVTFIDYANRFVCFQGALTCGTNTNGTPVMNIPTPYQPANTKIAFAIGTLGGTTPISNSCYFEIQTNGDVQCFDIFASMLSVRWSIVYGIDAPVF